MKQNVTFSPLPLLSCYTLKSLQIFQYVTNFTYETFCEFRKLFVKNINFVNCRQIINEKTYLTFLKIKSALVMRIKFKKIIQFNDTVNFFSKKKSVMNRTTDVMMHSDEINIHWTFCRIFCTKSWLSSLPLVSRRTQLGSWRRSSRGGKWRHWKPPYTTRLCCVVTICELVHFL